MTYLELVNSVLKRLRENTVATVTENDYSALVGEFVNDAKKKVEAAWQWSDLRDYITFSTAAGTASYSTNSYNANFSGSPLKQYTRLWLDMDSKEPICFVGTSGKEVMLEHVSSSYSRVQRVRETNQSINGSPRAFFLDKASARTPNLWNKSVTLYPTPDAEYSIWLWVVDPQDRLAQDNEVLIVPEDPVIQYAYLYCLYERGEELGEMLTLTEEKARQALADAIMHDEQIQKHELRFEAE